MAWNGMACDAPNNVMLMRNDHHGNASDSLVAMLASCPRPPPRIGGPCIMPGMEDARVGGSKRSFYSMFETSDDTGDGEIADDGSLHVEKKRRLTVEQVRSLEMSFEVENRLEPERKMQLAQELGLQPRQVAVWFQNRRARWKTKQLERDYDILKGAYDALLEENKKLKSEVNRLMKVNGGDEQPEDIVKKEVVEEEELEEDPIASCLKPSPSPEHALELSDELMSSLDTHGDVSSKSKSLTKEESPVSDGYHSEVLDTADSPASDRKPKKEILTQAELPAMITISAVINEEDDSAAFLQPVKDEPFTSECFSQMDYKLDDQLLEEEPYPEPLFGPEEQNGSWPWWDLHVFDANCGKG